MEFMGYSMGDKNKDLINKVKKGQPRHTKKEVTTDVRR